MIRVTLVCPETMIGDANHLAMALGEGPADGLTFGTPVWRDANGGLYSVASALLPVAVLARLIAPVPRPDWDYGRVVNVAGAGRARAAALVWRADSDDVPPSAVTADRVMVIAGLAPEDALRMIGLERLPEDAT